MFNQCIVKLFKGHENLRFQTIVQTSLHSLLRAWRTWSWRSSSLIWTLTRANPSIVHYMHVLGNGFVSFIWKGKLALKIHDSDFRPISIQGCQLGPCLIRYCGSRDERYNGIGKWCTMDVETFPQNTLVDHILSIRSGIAPKRIIIGSKFQQQLGSAIDGD